jgi:transcriptional regulator with XRE-family HTH domain
MDTASVRKAVIRDAASLGWVLSELRGINGATQQRTAEAVGMDRTQIAHLEAGRSGRYLTNLLDLLDHLGGTLVVEWTLQQRSSLEVESNPSSPVASTEETRSALAPVRAQTEAMQRALAPVRAQTEAMQRALAPVRAQTEAMQRALAPVRAQMEAIRQALPMPMREAADEAP